MKKVNKNKKITKQIPAYAIGGISDPASGAMSGVSMGASLGSVVPGIGTAIGAVVGGIGGAILGSSAKRKADRAKRRKEELAVYRMNEANSQVMQDEYYSQYGENVASFQYGGMAPFSGAAAVSDGEILKYGDRLTQVSAPNTGVDDVLVEMPDAVLGSMKIPGTKTTFEKEGEKILKKYNKKSKYNDKYAMNSQKLNSQNANNAYNGLLSLQEGIKARKGIGQKTKSIQDTEVVAAALGFADPYANYGGYMPSDGTRPLLGIPTAPSSVVKSGLSTGSPIAAIANPMMNASGGFNVGKIAPSVSTTMSKAVLPGVDGALASTPTAGAGFMGAMGTVGNVLGNVAQLAPTIYNLVKGTGEVVEEAPVNNPYREAYLNNMRKRRVNLSGLYADLERQDASNRMYVNQFANSGQRLAMLHANDIASRRQMQDIRFKEQELNNEHRREMGQAQYGVGADMANEQRRINEINAQNRAMQGNHLASAATQLGQYANTVAMRGAQTNQNQVLSEALRHYLSAGMPDSDVESLLKQYTRRG